MKDRFQLKKGKFSKVHKIEEIHIHANCFASSVGTALKCLKSLLLPTSIITILESA